MATNKLPNANGLSVNLLPDFYQTSTNKKFLQATIDQLYQPGTVTKTSGFIGSQTAKATSGEDVYVGAPSVTRQNYQLDPGIVIKDELDNITFFKDYQDYINQLGVFGANTSNHARLNKQEFYSWDPHIDWDKFVNFQNYYWLPYGPSLITIYGQSTAIASTYTVEIQDEQNRYQYLFTPNGLDLNPSIKLYRGQTYHFDINSPANPFSFKLLRSIGQSDRYVIPGISGYGVETGTITFTIPSDSPSVLFYQSEADINLGGIVEIYDIEESSKIDVTNDILGKKTYSLANGLSLSNGMKVAFGGLVTPDTYASGQYYVEGVGTAIKLVPESILEIISPYTTAQSILFDSTPFDTEPFSDSTGFASLKDYIVINRSSKDHNPWSRYNRWFHKDVISASASYNGTTTTLNQESRANRSIIEFEADLKLFNFGATAITDVDLVDDYTSDIFSEIEGTRGYNIDGVQLTEGLKILFTADPDPLVKDKIFQVSFLIIQGIRQIHLEEILIPQYDQVTLVRQGVKYQSQMLWYNGITWISAQQKTNTNQSPLFDLVDETETSYGNTEAYPGSTFVGTPIFSYKIATTGTTDAVLGFKLSYQNVNNVGDILFQFNLANDTFEYKTTSSVVSQAINTGYLIRKDYVGNPIYVNGWQICQTTNVQAARRVYKNSGKVNNFNLDIFDDVSKLTDLVVKVYVNGVRLASTSWQLVNGSNYKIINLNADIALTDILLIRAFSSQPINENGFYEIPFNLQNNPLNDYMAEFTLGEVSDHVNSIVDNVANFSGAFPGASNLRDLGSVSQYGTKFVQHSGPVSLALYHLTSEKNNVIKAIEKSREDYNSFKRNFVNVLGTVAAEGVSTSDFVEGLMAKINQNSAVSSTYWFSDMLAFGAQSKTDLTVVDFRIREYPLTDPFSLNVLSSKAVHIYLNGEQLLYGLQYTFNDQGFVIILDSVILVNGDIITTIEYDSTDGSLVPATPTKLGIWPKFEPKIYLDTSLVTPRMMIQGHDGSQTLAFGDYRDAVILELEKKIYNNIKVQYDPSIFDINDFIPGYNRVTDYSLSEFNTVLAPNFYKWINVVGVDFTKPLSYDRSNSFTYNYSNDVAPDGRNVPGYWRGIYRWLLDTDRPNLCPWEMLGFSIEPTWWTTVYGPAPYTSENKVLWQDLSDGAIKQPGKPVVVNKKYVRPFLINHIPVDESGNILSPQASGLATGIFRQSTDNNFVFGDVSPVESAWRRSSHFPFSVIIATMLMAPANTFGLLLDRSRIVRNKAKQLVYRDTGLRIRPMDIVVPSTYFSPTRIPTAGIVNYLVDYILSFSFTDNLLQYTRYASDLSLINVQLSYRIGAFTNKDKFNLLLESKTPLSTGNVFIPQEDYQVFLNTSSPIKKLTYSGVIITKLSTGFEVKGYSLTQPYFKIYNYLQSGTTINVGGISENYVNWTAGQQYISGTIVKYSNKFFRSISTNTAASAFDATNFASLPELPIVGGVNAIFRKKWDTDEEVTIPYGTTFKTVQQVVDFLLGYGEWLTAQGFEFNTFNSNLGSISNWSTSSKEFMFWTTQNWSTGQDKWSDWIAEQPYTYGSIVRYNGDYYSANYNILPSAIFDSTNYTKLDGLSELGSSVISLSPGASGIKFTTALSVVDNITNPFNVYEFFKVDGTPINSRDLDSYREGNEVSYTPKTNDGIYCASFYLIQNEHVIVINNIDIFNDVIYNPTSGYRRDRIKISGYVTTNWYGGLDIPGFIFDQAVINNWQAWQDYNMGDVVAYQGNYYSAITFLAGTQAFNTASWSRLSKKPNSAILPNWTNLATQFTDFYGLDIEGFDTAQQTMSHHLIGYQKREYLNNIIQDDVSEFKFYQGMIREKGTQNVLNKLFGVLTNNNEDSLKFYEEWALRVGRYGAESAFEDIEIVLDEALFRNNPQGYVLVPRKDKNINSFIVQQTPNDVYLKPLGYNSNPFPAVVDHTPLLRSAGYVNPVDVTFSLGTIADILTKDIDTLNNGGYAWAAFEGASWNIYRFTDLQIRVTDVSYNLPTKTLSISTANIIPFKEGSYVGLSQVALLKGFYKVESVKLNVFTVSATIASFPQSFTQQGELVVYSLISRRAPSIDSIDQLILSHLSPGELIWTDDDGTGKWASWKYDPIYNSTPVRNPTPQSNFLFGTSMTVDKNSSILAVGNSQGTVLIYDKVGRAVPWVQRDTLDIPFIVKNSQLDPSRNLQPNQVSTILAISTDTTWLATGSPLVGYACSAYVGDYVNQLYSVDDVVRIQTSVTSWEYYRAIESVPLGQAPSPISLYWETIPYISIDKNTGTDSNLAGQGVISIYKKDINNVFSLVDTIISPVPATNENFGSTLKFGNNTLYVGATGYDNNRGRVYKLNYVTIINRTYAFNPVGSSANTVVLSSSLGVREGMLVESVGFPASAEVTVEYVLTKMTFLSSLTIIASITAGMTVEGNNILPGVTVVYKGEDVNSSGQTTNLYVVVKGPQDLSSNITLVLFGGTISVATTGVSSLKTVILNGTPTTTPVGNINFVTKNWTYDFSEEYIGLETGSNFGSAIDLSIDESTLAISASGGIRDGQVTVYKNSSLVGILSSPTAGAVSNFGCSISLDNTGSFLVISDPYATQSISGEGVVTVFYYDTVISEYLPFQVLTDAHPQTNGLFGYKVSFMNDSQTIATLSKNGDTSIETTFNVGGITTFDKQSTNFITTQFNNGRVDIYDRYNTTWEFSESLISTNQPSEGYGVGFAVGTDRVVVSAPFATDNSLNSGRVYDYGKPRNTFTWTIDKFETTIPDVSKIKKAFLYNRSLGTLVTYLDYVDPLQGKIPGPAEEEIKFKTFYDPAIYSLGTDAVTVDSNSYWNDEQVGMLWWNLSTAKFLNNYFDDVGYRNNTWNTLATGASIDIYEWVGTKLKPEQWDAKADTPAGISVGISGTSLYGAGVYSASQTYDTVSKAFITTYFFWVKNKKVVPNIPGRYLTASDISSLITNPRGQGYTCLALTGTNSFSLINAGKYLQDTNVVLAIEYWTIDKTDQNIHSQWRLISNNDVTQIPPRIETKWIDSLCGKDTRGREVPDRGLPVKLRYGVENRPRQGMFINRIEAIKETVEHINSVLILNQITQSRDISPLFEKDAEPTLLSGVYDVVVDTNAELNYTGYRAFIRPELQPVIVNGRITSISIVSSGKGYANPPFITISGSGAGAVAQAILDISGSIIGAKIINSGEGYNSNTTVSIRDYSVLVHTDNSAEYGWAVFSYAPEVQQWERASTQGYDVTKYWSYTDWYLPDSGINQFTGPDFIIDSYSDITSVEQSLIKIATAGPTVADILNPLVKIKNGNSGKWVLLYRSSESLEYNNDWTNLYTVVGVQDGTIQLNSNLYRFDNTTVGYDSSIFDSSEFDVEASTELRIILTAIRKNILIDELEQEYLNTFFTGVRFAHREQPYIDWIFKTSFVRATHDAGSLDQPVNYPADNLSNFQDYINEVKPYKTKVREYITRFTNLDVGSTAITDFDLQPTLINDVITTIDATVVNGAIVSRSSELETYPFKFWYDNAGYTVTDIQLFDGGSGYITDPVVIITGSSKVQATARAYVSNGKVNRVIMITTGAGYLVAPTITFAGGLALGGVNAKGVAILGNGVVRSQRTALKFDRTTQTYYITDLQVVETFTGSGSRLQFALKWAPDIRVGKTSVAINGFPILRELFKVTLITEKINGVTQYSGKITFVTAPANASTIVVTYTKDTVMLNAADRILHYYNPTTGQLGKDLTQLMTGVDYGGVIVSGLGFDISGGWGTQGWGTDKWDNRDPTFNDYIVQVSANTHSFTYPNNFAAPAVGTAINVYYVEKKSVTYTVDSTRATGYNFDVEIISPAVSISSTTTSAAVTSTYDALNSFGFTLRVASTANIVVGMVISGTGFTLRQQVTAVVNSTTLTISAVPDSVPSGTLRFSNNAGSFILSVASVANLEVGNIVTCASVSAFSYNTTIKSIDTTNNAITLSNVLSRVLASGVTITFTQQLVEPTDIFISAAGTFKLSSAPIVGSVITLVGTYPSIRLDDPNYGTANQTNPSAIIPTIIGNGVTKTFTIPNTFIVNDGDEFIFRPSTSDGSVTPNESDYDTSISGGNTTTTLSGAFATATGIAAEDIVIDGDGFVTPTSSPAPEEVVPGQVVDTLAVKVFDQTGAGSATIKVISNTGDGTTWAYKIGQTPNSNRAVIVKLDSNILTYMTDYIVNYKDAKIEFGTTVVSQGVSTFTPAPPSASQIVSIYSIGFSGANVLDLDYFVANGTITEFITRAPWLDSLTSLVYVNGIPTQVFLFETDATYSLAGVVGIRFAVPPAANALINYILVSGDQQTFAITHTETILASGASTYKLVNQIGNKLPNESSMLVRVNQNILHGPSDNYFTIEKNKLNYTLDPAKATANSIDASNIKVYADGNILKQGIEYSFDPSGPTVKITKAIYAQYNRATLVISVLTDAGYSYNQSTNMLTLAQTPTVGSIVEVIGSYVHDILDIQRTEVGYTASYQVTPNTFQFYSYNAITSGLIVLDRPVIDNQYIWVVRNNTLLVPSIDYKLNEDLLSIQLLQGVVADDVITLITFGSNILPQSSISYMQFKDMLNRTVYKRLSATKRTLLAQPLRWNDTAILVNDASNFDQPNPSLNKPGIIEINGERIEYFAKAGNALSRLRRGTLGTGVTSLNPQGTVVQEIGASETIPYLDTVLTETIVSDGTNLVTLGYVPSTINAIDVFVGGYDTGTSWEPNTAYEVDQIVTDGCYTYRITVKHRSGSAFNRNVTTLNIDGSDLLKNVSPATVRSFFVGNIRLKKHAYSVFNVNTAPYSPAGDVTFPADFSLVRDQYGLPTNQIQLTNKLQFGTTVTVVKKTGIDWDGKTTPSILNDNTSIANFLKAVPGVWYVEYNKYSTTTTTTTTTGGTFDSGTATFDSSDITFDQG